MAEPDWIAVDWGTSRLRAWAMSSGGRVTDAGESDRGMGTLSRDGFEPALLSLVEDWLTGDVPPQVVICGMAGAREGWVEAPYRAVPCPPVGEGAARPQTRGRRLDVAIIPGLSQAHPPDVMRGEETQIAGLMALRPGFDGILCLPGTHTKWVEVSAGEVVSFRSAMTGELFALIATRSVLRHGMDGTDWDDDAFVGAIADGLSQPATITARLFGLRAEALLTGLAPATARARLSGMLIGMELAAMRPYWLGRAVIVVGAPGPAARYRTALAAQGVPAEIVDGDEAVQAGLAAARSALAREAA